MPRHLFIPDVPIAQAYWNRPFPVKIQDGVVISSSSQPAIMAEMLEQLAPRRKDRILEIGTGSGYNAALLAELVGSNGFVSTVDLDADIVELARQHLTAAGYGRVRTLCADGSEGDPANAPFDAIIATVGIGDISPNWVTQLRMRGRLVAPIILGLAQRVVAFERTPRCLRSSSVIGGEFMTFRGTSPVASSENVSLLCDAAIRLRTLTGTSVDSDALTRALHGGHVDFQLRDDITVDDLWESFDLWLSVHEPAFCRLTAEGSAAESLLASDSREIGSAASDTVVATFGLCERNALALFVPTARGISLRAFGNAAGCVDRLKRAMNYWDSAGRPSNANLTIRAFPKSTRSAALESVSARAQVVSLPSRYLVLQWAKPAGYRRNGDSGPLTS